VEYFFIGKQKIILFPKHRKNGWESAASALIGHGLHAFTFLEMVYQAFPLSFSSIIFHYFLLPTTNWPRAACLHFLGNGCDDLSLSLLCIIALCMPNEIMAPFGNSRERDRDGIEIDETKWPKILTHINKFCFIVYFFIWILIKIIDLIKNIFWN
jgi:hypothetical protein